MARERQASGQFSIEKEKRGQYSKAREHVSEIGKISYSDSGVQGGREPRMA